MTLAFGQKARRAAVAVWLAAAGASGCAAVPSAALPPASGVEAGEASVQLTAPALPKTYALADLLTSHTAASIHHVHLRLDALGADGAFRPTGATRSLSQAALASPIVLSGLKHSTAYRVVATAYAGADETQPPISVPEGSETRFETPAPALVGGAWTLAATPVVGPLKLRLADRAYVGTVKLNVNNSLTFWLTLLASRVTVDLQRKSGTSWSTLNTMTLTPTALRSDGLTLRNLRYGTIYRVHLSAETLLGPTSRDSSEIAVPAPVNGQIETDLGNRSF